MPYQKTHIYTDTTRTGQSIEISIHQNLSVSVNSIPLDLIEDGINEIIQIQTSNERGEGIVSAYYTTSILRTPKNDIYDLYAMISGTNYDPPYITIHIASNRIFRGKIDENSFDFSTLYDQEILEINWKSAIMDIKKFKGVYLHDAVAASSNPFHQADSSDTNKQKLPVGDLFGTYFFEKADGGAGTNINIATELKARIVSNYNLFRDVFINPYYISENDTWMELIVELLRFFFLTVGYNESLQDYIFTEYNPDLAYNEDLSVSVLAKNTSGLRNISQTTLILQTIDDSDIIEDADNNRYHIKERYSSVRSEVGASSFRETSPATNNYSEKTISIKFEKALTSENKKGIEIYDGQEYKNMGFWHPNYTTYVSPEIMPAGLYAQLLHYRQTIIRAYVQQVVDPSVPFKYRPYGHDYVVYLMRVIKGEINFLMETTQYEAIKLRSISRPISDLGNCRLWLAADQGVEKNSSNEVTAWRDQSAQNHDAIPVDGLRPTILYNRLNGQPILSFNLSILRFPDLANEYYPREYYIIATTNVINSSSTILQDGTGTGLIRVHPDLTLSSSSDNVTFSEDMSALQYDLIEITFFGLTMSAIEMRRNTKNLNLLGSATEAINTTGDGYIGADENGSASSRKWEGNLAEIICIQGNQSDQDRQKIRDYLADKYKLNYLAE